METEFTLALIGLILVAGGMMLHRTAGQRRRVAKRDPLKEIAAEREARESTSEGMILEMESRLFDYGREVEGRVETTLNVLDRLIIDAEQEVSRLEELLQTSRQSLGPRVDASSEQLEQQTTRLIQAGWTNEEIAQCLRCEIETVARIRSQQSDDGHSAAA